MQNPCPRSHTHHTHKNVDTAIPLESMRVFKLKRLTPLAHLKRYQTSSNVKRRRDYAAHERLLTSFKLKCLSPTAARVDVQPHSKSKARGLEQLLNNPRNLKTQRRDACCRPLGEIPGVVQPRSRDHRKRVANDRGHLSYSCSWQHTRFNEVCSIAVLSPRVWRVRSHLSHPVARWL